MPEVSLNCRDGEHEKCTGCPGCTEACHAVPPPVSFREAREELAEKLAARREEGGEE